MNDHLCMPSYAGLPGGMRELYGILGMLATSTTADTVLIRSHVAYHCGAAAAERAVIKPSRGHSYRVAMRGHDTIVRIVDHYDHRDGVTGLVATTI